MVAPVVGIAFLVCVLGHPNSLSSSPIQIVGHQVSVTSRCQVLSLLEVIDGLDANGDGAADRTEIVAKTGAIQEYFEQHYVHYTGTDRSLHGGYAPLSRADQPEILSPRPR